MGLELEGIETLRAELRGRLLLPSEAAFTQATSVWSVSPNHPARLPAPALVVQPRGERAAAGALRSCRTSLFLPACQLLDASPMPDPAPGEACLDSQHLPLPAGTADVSAAVKFAAAHGLPLAVRGGGHGGVSSRCWLTCAHAPLPT